MHRMAYTYFLYLYLWLFVIQTCFDICLLLLYAFKYIRVLYWSIHGNLEKYTYILIFVYFISYSLPYYDFSPKKMIIFEDSRSIVINDSLYTLKFDNSPSGEISTSPTQRCMLQTGSHTSNV